MFAEDEEGVGFVAKGLAAVEDAGVGFVAKGLLRFDLDPEAATLALASEVVEVVIIGVGSWARAASWLPYFSSRAKTPSFSKIW